MKSLRLLIGTLILAGCAAESPGAAPAGSPDVNTVPPGTEASSPSLAPGASPPPRSQRVLPSATPDDPNPTPRPAGSSSSPTPTPRATSSTRPLATPTPRPTATPTPKPSGSSPVVLITPPPPPPTSTTIATFSGTGPARTASFSFEPGDISYKLTHTGSGEFLVWQLNDRRQKMFTVVMATGNVSKTVTINSPNGGTRYLEVEKGGSWSITVAR